MTRQGLIFDTTFYFSSYKDACDIYILEDSFFQTIVCFLGFLPFLNTFICFAKLPES